jgi:hypothetical protein
MQRIRGTLGQLLTTVVLLVALANTKHIRATVELLEIRFHRIDVPKYTWGGSRKTLVIAVRYGCHYCEASQPFYGSLIKDAKDIPPTNLRIVFVAPDDMKMAMHAVPSTVTPDLVRANVLFPTWIEGTPTVVAVDEKGTIVRIWQGLLGPSQQDEVLQWMKSR